MKFDSKTVRKTINKAFLKEPVERTSFNAFKNTLQTLLDQVEAAEKKGEHEEHFKNFLVPFFKDVGFSDYPINTSKRIDLAIHTGKGKKDPVGVLLEVKRPSNAGEMITQSQLNRKAMYEAVLYYLEQRIEHDNSDIKHVIITDMNNWFIFDAQEFERCFYKPSTLRDVWKEWKADRKVSSNNDFMYKEISRFMDDQSTAISGLWLPLDKTRKYLKGKEDSDYEKKLIPLYKLFTPTHLLKEPFANDSNSLNREFYRELLYILGLVETKKGNTRYIQRAEKGSRNSGAFIENTIRILDSEDHLSTLKNELSSYGSSREEQLFSVAMELSITWMNRILFLKLLEAQLYRYHRQDSHFKFLNFDTIDGLDELNKLFFQVLARKEKDRSDSINEKFGHIPYLNSSLFDVSSLEHQTTRISGLDDNEEMPVYSKSVLTKERGNSLNTLDYLFRFLEAYDFSAEGSEEIRDESKSLINASVLGLIFEKINGYKDGSFYTPGFITEYMARETLRKAVVDKFRGALEPSRSPGNPPSSRPDGHQPSSRPSGDGHPSPRGEGDFDRGMSSEIPRLKLPESLLENARHLRKNQTPAEEMLWKLVRKKQLGTKFRRQHPIEEGFIIDFYNHEHKLGIELDGGYHNEENQKVADEERERILNDMDIHILRFKNEDIINNTEQVLEKILKTIPPSPRGRGNEGEGEDGSRMWMNVDDGQESTSGEPAGEGKQLTFNEIYNRIGRDISIQQANELVNSIMICDPAVGSGHFLVSCLNELIAIKAELGILCDGDGKILRGVEVVVENDELIVSYGEELFEYDVSHTWTGNRLTSRKVAPDKQRIQQILFREKKHLIENCLFGVDINPNSVKICRLRLWIELLKRAYYEFPKGPRHNGPLSNSLPGNPLSNSLPRGERIGGAGALEVLPNIDINIKQGNSLVSRFDLDTDLSSVFKDSKHSLEDYKEAVRSYKHTGDRTEKARLQTLIEDIKSDYSTTLYNNSPINKKLSKERGKLELMQSDDLFGDVKFTQKQVKAQKKKVKKLEAEKADEEAGAFYNQAFEWRFEFPEVLDDEGRFTGFDVVIANPPYGNIVAKNEKTFYRINYSVAEYNFDVYNFFFERSLNLLKSKGFQTFITPNTYLVIENGKRLRELLFGNCKVLSLVDTYGAFEEAVVETIITILKKDKPDNESSIDIIDSGRTIDVIDKSNSYSKKQINLITNNFSPINYKIRDEQQELYEHLKKDFIKLESIAKISAGLKPYETGKGNPPQTKNIVKNKPYTGDELVNKEWSPLVVGKNINNFEIVGETKFVKYGPWLAAPRDPEIYKSPKLFIRRTDDSIKAAYDDSSMYGTNSVHCLNVNDPDKKLVMQILAILNSKLIDWFYKVENYHMIGKPLAEVKIVFLNRLPIEKKISKGLVQLVNQRIQIHKSDSEANTNELAQEIDRLVYELYGLSEEEIGIVEGTFK